MSFGPCGKVIKMEIPGTNVQVDLICKYAAGHTSNHVGKCTVDGIEIEAEYADA